MKFFEKMKSAHIQHFLLLSCMYILGALADGFGYLNWLINISGIGLQFAAMTFIIFNFSMLFDSGLLASRKAAVINLSLIFVGLTFVSICWNLKMISFLITIGIFLIFNFIMLITAMYRLTRVYMDLLDNDKQEKSVTEPKGKIRDFFTYF